MRKWNLNQLQSRIYDSRLYFQCPFCKPTHTCTVDFSKLTKTGNSLEDISLRPEIKNFSPMCKHKIEITNGVVYERS